jgi:DNA-binding Xre family transcriptional regulator
MKWSLRLAAAQTGVWTAAELRRRLAERGLEISVGKMSRLWGQDPGLVRFDELDAICAVLGCQITDLMVAEPERAPVVNPREQPRPAAAAGPVPIRGPGRSLPPR